MVWILPVKHLQRSRYRRRIQGSRRGPQKKRGQKGARMWPSALSGQEVKNERAQAVLDMRVIGHFEEVIKEYINPLVLEI